MDQVAVDRIDSLFLELFNNRKFNGVALFSRDGATHTLSHGYRNLKTRDSLQLTDQFQLASLSKPFTAYAVLQLVDQGYVKLDDKVSDHLVCVPYSDVTIHQLLTHTSGIGYYAYVTDHLWGMPEDPMSNADLLALMECEQIPLYFQAGRSFDYCNTNYVLLAMIVEAVSEMTFEEYMEQTLFPSLNMRNSEIVNPFDQNALQYAVQGHYPNGEIKMPSYLDGVVGDKGMYSTVDDLYAFYRTLKDSNLISDTLWEKAVSPIQRAGKGTYYGYGWRINPMPESNDTLIYHNGWWRGFRSYFWMSKKEDKMCVILTNSIRGGYLPRNEIWLRF